MSANFGWEAIMMSEETHSVPPTQWRNNETKGARR